ncbi:uncharacterized protein LOC110456524 [Mizuhopecten yessoensis]|uniref:Pancreas transcription factor 1 subunit alpha n=1 Tax=Mizuhopecten yessoensis TaxID=6573 RepID=A0A210QAQ9_MIZYE|nr:uncharacterized protein LOC110456524 [Mizuhopecten yessoensis]OWF45818.1 Pancreas transcription factor 1 subunit alpha [Mizuhopecten yessoensis]
MDRGSRDVQKDIESKEEALDRSYTDLSDESDDDGPIDLTMECVSVKEEPSSDSQETKTARNTDGRYKRRKVCDVRISRQLCEVSEETKRRTANIQERHRMQRMSSALQQLKDSLPDEFKLYNKKLSKIRTLRIAIGYIRALESMLKSAPTPVKREQFPIGTPRVPGPNEAYLAALGTCTPLPFPTPGTNDAVETLYTHPAMYSAYFPSSPYWNTEGLQSPATCMMPLPLCYETPNYPTPNVTPASATPRFTPIQGKHPSHRSDGGSHRLSSVAKRLVRSSVYPSPFGDGRNANELNTSFLSAGSEEVTEPDDDGGRERFSNDCCFSIEGVYPLPPDDTPLNQHKDRTGYAGR